MSRENLEIVRRMAAVWNERRWRGVIEAGLLDPGIEYHDDQDWPGARSAFGTAAFLDRFDEVLDAIGEGGHVEVERTAGEGDYVCLVFRLSGEGTSSHIPYEYRWGFVCRVTGGQIDYIQAYLDPKRALQAVGLRE
jgi:ketosteroid isomerase-like protein